MAGVGVGHQVPRRPFGRQAQRVDGPPAGRVVAGHIAQDGLLALDDSLLDGVQMFRRPSLPSGVVPPGFVDH
jgi:hypothetical protein